MRYDAPVWNEETMRLLALQSERSRIAWQFPPLYQLRAARVISSEMDDLGGAVRTGQADEILRRGLIMIRSVCINFIPRQGLDPVAVLLASRLVNCQLVGVQVLEIVGRNVAEAGL